VLTSINAYGFFLPHVTDKGCVVSPQYTAPGLLLHYSVRFFVFGTCIFIPDYGQTNDPKVRN